MENKLHEKLVEMGFSMETQLIGDDFDIMTIAGRMEQSHWKVTIKRNNQAMEFDYHMGSGHRHFGKDNGKTISIPFRPTHNDVRKFKNSKPNRPTLSDCLYSCVSDAQLSDCSFDEFCDELGYSNDSIKAKSIYDACCDTYFKLRKLGFDVGSENELTELFQDY